MQDTIEAFDYSMPPEAAGTQAGPRYGGSYRRPGTWIEFAKQFADTVNGCAAVVLCAKRRVILWMSAEPSYGGGYRRAGTWIDCATQFADTVNGCGFQC